MFQPSYMTGIQIWSMFGYLRLKMPEKKRCKTNWRDNIVRFSGNELWKRVAKQEFVSKPRRGWGGGWWTQQQFIENSKDGFLQLCEQGDSIWQIKCYNEICSRKTYPIKHQLKGAAEIWAYVAWLMLEWWFDNQCTRNETIVHYLTSNKVASNFGFTHHS